MTENPFTRNHDALQRYAAARGVPYRGSATDSLRLAVRFAVDVNRLARRDRVSVLTVVSRALAGYLTERDGLR